VLTHLLPLVFFRTRLCSSNADPRRVDLFHLFARRFTPNAIATDPSGNIYVAGSILVDPAAFQITVLVIKLNPKHAIPLCEVLGGSVNDYANAITVDGAGNA